MQSRVLSYFIVVILFSLTYQLHVKANHLLGGGMRYDCLGYSNSTQDSLVFSIEMQMLINCAISDNLENFTYISIYEKIDTAYIFMDTYFFPPEDSFIVIDNHDINCFDHSFQPCVRMEVYQRSVILKKSTNTYVAIYQRCCISDTFSNISHTDIKGVTLAVEISAAAQNTCNSSPYFPPIPVSVICAGQETEISFHTQDSNQDVLSYEFCTPFQGGGPEGFFTPGSSIGCNGINPYPACPPPFETMDFIEPIYQFDAPFGVSSPTLIDVDSGILNLTPNTMGRFIFGICISDYQNGTIVSNMNMFYQLTAAACEPIIDIAIENDSLQDGQYFINSCDDLSVQLRR